MNIEKTIFSQLMDFLPLHEFRKCVKRYNGNYKVQKFSCYTQFLCMAFAQLTYRESLRDIEACLGSMKTKLYHMGIRHKISRSTLADANEKRDWRIYADFAQVLMHIAKKLYIKEQLSVDLKNMIYALDSSIIKLCLSLCPWAYYQHKTAAIKLHALLNLKGNIPAFAHITSTSMQDFQILDNLTIEPGSFYIMDRGYIDLSRLYALNLHHAFFVIRSKKHLRLRRLYSLPIDKSTGLRHDHITVFTGRISTEHYPEKIRHIRLFDSVNKVYYIFLTNNFVLPALTITELYRQRWQVELFFRWIKQNLRIKKFFGTSENAIKTQIWIAISVYLLVAIVRKTLNISVSLYTFLQILSVNIFEKKAISRAFSDDFVKEQNVQHYNQLTLFEL